MFESAFCADAEFKEEEEEEKCLATDARREAAGTEEGRTGIGLEAVVAPVVIARLLEVPIILLGRK